MPIEVSCRKCGKAYRVKDERAGTKIKCKDCQTVIEVPQASEDDYADEMWSESATQPLRSRNKPRTNVAVKKTTGSTGGTLIKKVFGVLALLLAGVMVLGIGVQLTKGNVRSLGGLVVVAAVGGVGIKWLK